MKESLTNDKYTPFYLALPFSSLKRILSWGSSLCSAQLTPAAARGPTALRPEHRRTRCQAHRALAQARPDSGGEDFTGC